MPDPLAADVAVMWLEVNGMLTKADALRMAHEVAAWIAFERDDGAFFGPLHWFNKTGIAWQVRPHLGGSCAIASTILAVAIRSRGTLAGIVNHPTEAHLVVSTECGLIIDATASQFGHDGPIVRKRGKLYEQSKVCVGASPAMAMQAHLSYEEPFRQHPFWPVHHENTIRRILTRMGVTKDELDALSHAAKKRRR